MKHFTNSIYLFLVVLFMSTVLAACAGDPGNEDDTGSDDANSNEAAGEEGGGGDLIIAQSSDTVSLDPVGSNDTGSYDVQINIYETLVQHDENLEPQPGLAESWEAIEENLWEFKLQEGIVFHDGSAFNADVAKKNIERIIDPEVASSQAALFEMITNIEAVDEYTLHIETEYPFAPLVTHLAHPVSGMVSSEVIDEDYAAMEDGAEPGTIVNENPVGTGYFQFDEWNPGENVRLTKNEDYWDGEALLDSVTFKVVGEDLTRIAEITTGDAHIANPVNASDIETINQTDGTSVHERPSVGLSYIGFNMDKEPFDDQRVRQAITMAIDKEQILEGIYNGAGVAAVGPIPPDAFGFDDSVSSLDYDIDEAKRLLAEAGYEDGFSTTLWTNESREFTDTAVNVQAQLEEIGIEINIQELEGGAYLEQTANGEHDMFILGWFNGTGDPDYAMHPLFHSQNAGAPGNRSFLRDSEIDELLEKGRRTSDEAERLEVYKEAQEKLVDLAPMIYMNYIANLLGVRDEVQGLKQMPNKYLLLKDVYIEQ